MNVLDGVQRINLLPSQIQVLYLRVEIMRRPLKPKELKYGPML